MKGFIRSRLALTLAVLIMSAATITIPLSRNIAHAQAGISINLNFHSLPSAQGFTYFQGGGIPESRVFSVNGKSLTQNTIGIGDGDPNYAMFDVVDGSQQFVLTVRVKILKYQSSRGAPGGFFFDVRTATPEQEYPIFFTKSLVTDPLGNGVAIDTTVFHTYTLTATPGGNYSLYIDGLFAFGGPVCGNCGNPLNAVQFGDGANLYATNAKAKITEFVFSQPPL